MYSLSKSSAWGNNNRSKHHRLSKIPKGLQLQIQDWMWFCEEILKFYSGSSPSAKSRVIAKKHKLEESDTYAIFAEKSNTRKTDPTIRKLELVAKILGWDLWTTLSMIQSRTPPSENPQPVSFDKQKISASAWHVFFHKISDQLGPMSRPHKKIFFFKKTELTRNVYDDWISDRDDTCPSLYYLGKLANWLQCETADVIHMAIEGINPCVPGFTSEMMSDLHEIASLTELDIRRIRNSEEETTRLDKVIETIADWVEVELFVGVKNFNPIPSLPYEVIRSLSSIAEFRSRTQDKKNEKIFEAMVKLTSLASLLEESKI